MSGYLEADLKAATLDLIFTERKLVTINGHTIHATVDRGSSDQEASEYGADTYAEELSCTADTQGCGSVTFESPVIYQKRRYRITGIENITETIKRLTCESDNS